MTYKNYQTTFVDYVKKLDYDQINLLIYLARLAIFHKKRDVTVSYIDVSYHLNLKGKGKQYIEQNISSMLSLYFEQDGVYFPLFEKVQLRNNHFDVTLTPQFEEESFYLFVKAISTLSPNVIHNINKHHAIYLYLRIKEELAKREMTFDFSLYLTTAELKSVFGLGKYHYLDEDGFNRSKFEKNYLVSSVEDINQWDDSISLNWEKVKEKRLVSGYLFQCGILKQ